MKRLSLIMLLISMFISIMIVEVHAAQAKVEFVGQKEVETGKEYTINVKVSNEVAVGVVQGTLSYDSNIQNVTINASYNGWTTTYNAETGTLNSFNAAGTKEGEIIQITYKLKDGANSGTITISNIELTTIDYNTINLDGKVTQSINKKVEKQDTPIENNETNTSNTNVIIPETQTNEVSNNKISNNEISNNDNSTVETPKVANQSEKKSTGIVTNEVSSTAKQNLPHTGKSVVTILIVISILAILAILFYKKMQI